MLTLSFLTLVSAFPCVTENTAGAAPIAFPVTTTVTATREPAPIVPRRQRFTLESSESQAMPSPAMELMTSPAGGSTDKAESVADPGPLLTTTNQEATA